MSQNRLYCVTAVLLLIGLLLPGQATAQDPTAAESVHERQNWDRFRIERQIQQATSPMPGVQVTSPQLPPPDIDGASHQKIFKLHQVIFEPVPRAVPKAELEAVAIRYIAMEAVSIYDLYSMVVEIDGLFDKRHVLGRAGLPVQDVDNGVVTVQILEGRETGRTISNKVSSFLNDTGSTPAMFRRLGNSFVQRQFRFSGNPTFNLQNLEEEILRYNRTFRSRLAAEIEPGADLGDCTLKLTRLLPQPVSGGYFVDNSGRETSGRIRQGVYMNLLDILGANESFFISYDKTEGTTALYMQGDVPVTRFGTFLDMSYYSGEPKTISGATTVLNINGTSEQYRPGVRQILVNQKEQRLDATLYYQNYDSKTFFDTALTYAEKHDAWTVGLEYSRRKAKSALFAGMSLVAGEASTTAPIPAGYVDSGFCLMKLNLMKVWYPTDKWTFILRGNGNASFSELPQSQFFQIGGMATVRGTPEAFMSGDSGYLTVAEARRVIWRGSDTSSDSPGRCDALIGYIRKDWRHHSRAEIFTFIDHGGVFSRDSDVSGLFLSSVGAGATVNLGRHCSLSGGYGQPIFTEGARFDAYREQLRHGNVFFTARASF